MDTEPKKRGRGRPKKGEIVALKKKNTGVIGRPKGDTAIINEYKIRMLNSPKSAKVSCTRVGLDRCAKYPTGRTLSGGYPV